MKLVKAFGNRQPDNDERQLLLNQLLGTEVVDEFIHKAGEIKALPKVAMIRPGQAKTTKLNNKSKVWLRFAATSMPIRFPSCIP